MKYTGGKLLFKYVQQRQTYLYIVRSISQSNVQVSRHLQNERKFPRLWGCDLAYSDERNYVNLFTCNASGHRCFLAGISINYDVLQTALYMVRLIFSKLWSGSGTVNSFSFIKAGAFHYGCRWMLWKIMFSSLQTWEPNITVFDLREKLTQTISLSERTTLHICTRRQSCYIGARVQRLREKNPDITTFSFVLRQMWRGPWDAAHVDAAGQMWWSHWGNICNVVDQMKNYRSWRQTKETVHLDDESAGDRLSSQNVLCTVRKYVKGNHSFFTIR